MGSPTIFNGNATKLLTQMLRLNPQDSDPSNPQEGDVMYASSSHGTRDEGLYIYSTTEGDWTTWTDSGSGQAGLPTGDNAYFLGGDDNGVKAAGVSKWVISTGTSTTLGDSLDQAVIGPCGGQSATKGYTAAGNGNATYEVDMEAITFAGEAVAAITTNLSVGRNATPGDATSATDTYIVGGNTAAASSDVIEKFTHTGESIATILATLGSATRNIGSCESTTDGYFAGGTTGVADDNLDSLEFATDTQSLISASFLSTTRTYLDGHSEPTKGYFGGGYNGGTTASNIIHDLTFSTETGSVDTETLNTSRGEINAAYSTTKGIWAGGYTGAVYSDKVEEYDYSGGTATESGTALTRKPAQAASVQGN